MKGKTKSKFHLSVISNGFQVLCKTKCDTLWVKFGMHVFVWLLISNGLLKPMFGYYSRKERTIASTFWHPFCRERIRHGAIIYRWFLSWHSSTLALSKLDAHSNIAKSQSKTRLRENPLSVLFSKAIEYNKKSNCIDKLWMHPNF